MLCDKCKGDMKIYAQDNGDLFYFCPFCEHEDLLRDDYPAETRTEWTNQEQLTYA